MLPVQHSLYDTSFKLLLDVNHSSIIFDSSQNIIITSKKTESKTLKIDLSC